MIFTSLHFLLFFPVVVALYFILSNRLRCGSLLVASYYFYMVWKPAYAGLMFFETIIVYLAAILLDRNKNELRKKLITGVAISINLGLLFVFKYYNFFEQEMQKLGWGINLPTLDLLLPLGISFYTFHAISYLVDVYRGAVQTERHLGVLLLYIAYFPLLVAGPIARAAHLIPQLRNLTKDNGFVIRFEYGRVVSGLRLMLLGFFKKIVLADNLALFVQPVYAAPEDYSGFSALIATLAFTFQIFFDFSAYTDIARGASRVLGIELTRNFLRPYFATTIPNFWRRWHISLSTWFRDYLYIPMGGNQVATWRWLLNLWIVFILCGMWHGANWTFLIWGGLHGFYFLMTYLLTPPARWVASNTLLKHTPNLQRAILILFTFSLVCWAWVMFRAESLSQALTIWKHMAQMPFEAAAYINLIFKDGVPFAPLDATGLTWLLRPAGKLSMLPVYIAVLTILYLIIAFLMRHDDDGGGFAKWPWPARWMSYIFALFSIAILGHFGGAQFIYFQF